MAKLVDLKQPKLTKKELSAKMEPSLQDEDSYPWGTRLNFDDDMVEKLPQLKELDVGEKVTITAEGKVVEKSVNDRQGGEGPRYRCEIQITKLALASEEDYDAAMDEAMDDE